MVEHLGLQDSPLNEGTVRSQLAQLQLNAERVLLPMAVLSGGERLKAALACMLWRREPAQLLLLDEPTNHLDLASSLAIEASLASFPGAMLVVSHDENFLQALKLTHRLQWQAGNGTFRAYEAHSCLRAAFCFQGMHSNSRVKAAAICSSGTQAKPISRPRRWLGNM